MSDELNDFLKHWPKPAQLVSLGTLNLDSPALAICDPVGLALTEESDKSMFVDASFPIGDAELSLKKWSIDDRSHTAFLIINFTEADVTVWERAEKAGGPHVFDEFDVDYGNVGFMSEAMHAAFLSSASKYKDSPYDEWLWPFIEGEGDDEPDIAEIPLSSGAVFKAVCAPGGNGAYDAFIGRSSDGSIVSVVLDLISPALDLL